MTFYNPFFANLPIFPFEKSTKYAPTVDNNRKKSTNNTYNEKKESNPVIPSDFTQKNQEESPQTQAQKNNHQHLPNLGKINDYLQETDSLILLALLYFLYTQKTSSGPLMICLLLLLLDND